MQEYIKAIESAYKVTKCASIDFADKDYSIEANYVYNLRYSKTLESKEVLCCILVCVTLFNYDDEEQFIERAYIFDDKREFHSFMLQEFVLNFL